jgi:predicted metal-dependent peptidase
MIKNKPTSVRGGGGTNPLDVIKRLNEDKKYSAAIMFSDGFIFGRWEKPVCKPILWVITKDGNLGFNFPGKKIKAID